MHRLLSGAGLIAALGCTNTPEVVAPPAAPPPPAAGMEPAPPAPDPPPPPPAPTFSGTRSPIPDAMRIQMTGLTWHTDCPVHLDELALLELSHWDMEGTVQQGQLVVAASEADALLGVFRILFDEKFPIQQMRPAHEFGGSDDASMAANNTSAFNCRKKTGGQSWSEHSYGAAIDVNTIQNPYVRGARVLPPEGRPHVDRDPTVPGLIVAEGPVVSAFRDIGWKWGGHWRSLKDYQHFSASGK